MFLHDAPERGCSTSGQRPEAGPAIPQIEGDRALGRLSSACIALIPGQYGVGATVLAASAVIGIIPVIVFYVFAQRHIVGGMTAGAVK